MRRAALVAIVLLIGMAAGLIAQESTGNIYGLVQDEQGGALPGATATLTGETTAPLTTVSDAGGRFRFLRVSPGRYTVSVELAGMSKAVHDNVIVTLGKNTDLNVALKLSGVQEAVVVSSATPLIDTRKTETGVTFSEVELEEIPTSRDVWAMMQQVPGIQLDSVNVAGSASGTQPNFISKGKGQVTYQIDGVTITDNSYGAYDGGQNGKTPLYFDFGSFEEMEISTGGSTMDLETPGATVNVVTKRGTNEFHGSVRGFYADGSWQSTNLPDEAVEQEFETNQIRKIQELGFDIGGPIMRDRLWFWGAFSDQTIDVNLVGTDPDGNRIKEDVDITTYNAKVNWQITQANSANVFYSRSDRTDFGFGASPSRPPVTTADLDIPTYVFKIEDSHVFSPNFTATAFYSYLDTNYYREPRGGRDIQAAYYDDLWHNSYKWYTTYNPQHQVNASANTFFNTGNAAHELKFGFGYRQQLNESGSAWPGDAIQTSDFGGSSTYALVTREVFTTYKTRYWSASISDTVTWDRLTVNGGLRYDLQQGKNEFSQVQANPTFPDLFPADSYDGDEGWPVEFEDLEPRISATYALGKERKTLLRASYSRFADQLGNVVYRLNRFPIVSGIYYYWEDVNDDHLAQRDEVYLDTFYGFYNVDPFAENPNAFDPNFETPKTDEFLIGVDHQLTNDFALSLNYTYRYFSDLQGRMPLGSSPDTWELVGTATGTATAANGFSLPFSVPFYGLTLDEPTTGQLFLNRPDYDQTYHGLEFQALKRLANRWMMRGSFTWMDWTQDVGPDSLIDPNNRWALGGQNDDGGIAVGYGRGTIWMNSRWAFNVSGLWQGPWGINVAGNFFGREGNPAGYYLRARTGDVDGTRPSNVIGHIDDFRLDDIFELDVRLEKVFKVGQIDITPSLDIFNVLNENAVLQRENFAGDFNLGTGVYSRFSGFNEIIEVQNPRIVRLGVRVSF